MGEFTLAVSRTFPLTGILLINWLPAFAMLVFSLTGLPLAETKKPPFPALLFQAGVASYALYVTFLG
jgi:hypothetical protein